MTFLNSAILAALTLGLLPILIHLLNRQRYKKIDFPTLRFLHELQRQKMRQVRIRQIILLILRTLAVLFIVLAIARPVVKSSTGLLPGAEAHSTAVLILDRSASMRTETPDGTRFRQVQTRAQEILNALQDGDEAQIVWADTEPEVIPEQPTTQIRLLRETVGDARPTLCGGDLVKALQKAREILGKSQNLHKEVYVLSDFSVSAWPEKMPESELIPKDVRLFELPLDGPDARNLGITSAVVTSRIITPGRAVEVSFTVYNSSTTPAADRIVSVYLGGRRVAQTRVTLAPGESKLQRLKFVPDSPGDQVGYVRIEEADDFPDDDQRNFVLRVPARLNVAVAGNDGAARSLTVLALNPSADPDAFVHTTELTPAALEGEDWNPFDAIVIVDASDFNSVLASRLRKFIEDGKGAFIIPGPQADLRAYAAWLPALGLPVPTEVWQAESGSARWNRVDYAHPLFEGLFEEQPQSISPEITKLMRVSPGGAAVEVISISTGAPFLLESRIGRGRVLMMTGSPDPTWSTLYRSGIFPPLMVRGAAYLSGIGASGEEYQLAAGVPASLTFAGLPGEEPFELRGEKSIVPAVEPSAVGYEVKIPPLDTPGAYELWHGTRRMAAVAVNLPARESELQPARGDSYEPILGGTRTTVGEQASVQAAILEGRFGRELWELCLFLALAFLAAEMLVGRVGKREAVAV
jgi:hypothetical protein